MSNSSQYRKRDYEFANTFMTLRTTIGLTQQSLAKHLGISSRAVENWEQGLTTPKAEHLKAFLALCVQASAFVAGREEEQIRAFWKTARLKVLLDEYWLQELLAPLSPSPTELTDKLSPSPESSTATPLQATTDLSQHPTSPPRIAFPSIWMIPSSRNPFFLGRDELLSHLHTQLQMGQATALSQPQAVSGLGGIGKTQIAIEYAYRYAQEYQVVLWARAESLETLNASYSRIAVALDLPQKEEKKQEIIIEAVKIWLQHHLQWLFILDNADDLTIIKHFLPSAMGGHLLITTRAGTTGRLAKRIEVETFTEEQGMLFLLRRASHLPPDAPLSQATEQDQARAQQIVRELGALPLALDQAGAYIDETECNLDDYLTLYQTQQNCLLKHRGMLSEDYPQSIASTWSLSFERVEQANPLAADLLRFCAFLSPDTIPEEIIIKGSTHLGPLLAPLAENPFLLNEAILALRTYSLVHRDPQTHTLSVHRLVQAVLRDSMTIEKRREWKQRVVLAIHEACPNVEDIKQWDACEQWLPHAFICALWIEQEQMTTEEAASLLYKTGFYLHGRARYTEAEPLLLHALRIREHRLGPLHPDVGHSLNRLAILYWNQSKYTEAEPLFLRTLHIWEQSLGPRHSLVAHPLNRLAILYQNQGKYAEAEPLYVRTLQILEQSLGPDYPLAIFPFTNLANLYQNQGRYAEAEPLYIRALQIWEQRFAPHYPLAASPLINLANLYQNQGKYVEAESLYMRALQILEQRLGPDHPYVAYPLEGLANLYKKRGRGAEAEPLYIRALQTWERNLDTNHPLANYTLTRLANLYKNQGKYAEAEPLYMRALQLWEQSLGPHHPLAVYPLEGLANLHQEQGKYAEAEPLYVRVLQILEQSPDPDQPLAIYPLTNLANLYKKQGRGAEAEPLYVRVLQILEQSLGPGHPLVATSLTNLANLYQEQGKYAQAEPLNVRALQIREQSLGPDHYLTQKARKNYDLLLRAIERDEEAKKLEEKT